MSSSASASTAVSKHTAELVHIIGWAMAKNYNFVVEGAMKTLFDDFGIDEADTLLNEDSFFNKYLPIYSIRQICDCFPDLEKCNILKLISEFDQLHGRFVNLKAETGKRNDEWKRMRFKIVEIIGAGFLMKSLESDVAPKTFANLEVPMTFDYSAYASDIENVVDDACQNVEMDGENLALAAATKKKLLDITGTGKKMSLSTEKIFGLVSESHFMANSNDLKQFIDDIEKIIIKQYPQLSISSVDRFNEQNKINAIAQPAWTEDKNRSSGPYSIASATPKAVAVTFSSSAARKETMHTSINYQKEFSPSDPLHKVASSPSVQNSAQAINDTTNDNSNTSSSSSSSSSAVKLNNNSSSKSNNTPSKDASSSSQKASRPHHADDSNSSADGSSSKRPRSESANPNPIPSIASSIGTLRTMMQSINDKPTLSPGPLNPSNDNRGANLNRVTNLNNQTRDDKVDRAPGQRLKWTIAEEEAFASGVEKHGVSNWAEILNDPEFSFILINRNSVNLKDKWRTINKPK